MCVRVCLRLEQTTVSLLAALLSARYIWGCHVALWPDLAPGSAHVPGSCSTNPGLWHHERGPGDGIASAPHPQWFIFLTSEEHS